MQRRKSEATLQVPGQEQLQKPNDDKAGGNGGEPADGNGRAETGGQAGEIGLRAQIELISKLAMKGMQRELLFAIKARETKNNTSCASDFGWPDCVFEFMV